MKFKFERMAEKLKENSKNRIGGKGRGKTASKATALILAAALVASPASTFAAQYGGTGVELDIQGREAAKEALQTETYTWINPTIPGYEMEQSPAKGALPAAYESAGNLFQLEQAIYDNMSNRTEIFTINYTGDTANLKSEITSIMDDIDSEDEYLANSRGGYSWQYGGYVNDVDVSFTVSYLHDKQEEEYIESRTDEILSQIITQEMTDIQKIKAVNDYIVLNTRYGTGTIASAHSPYAILTEGEGVCQAYALLMYKMLGKLGFEQRYVSGDAGGPHAWNMVKTGGKWYFIDSTWNDPVITSSSTFDYNVSYKYFMTSAQYISSDHQFAAADYPHASSQDYSYFHKMAHTASDGEQIFYRNESDSGALYRSSIDGSGDMQITQDSAYHMAAGGEWVYYSNYSNGGYIYKVPKSGGSSQKVNSSKSGDLRIEGDRLYYLDESDMTTKYMEIEDPQNQAEHYPGIVLGEWEEPFAQKTVQDKGKTWKISFSKIVDESSVTKDSIFVAKMDGSLFEKTQFDLSVQGSSIQVSPSHLWEIGEYYLFISQGIMSGDGKELLNKIKMKFVVE